MSLDDLLKKARMAGKTARESLTELPAATDGSNEEPPVKRLRYLVDLGKSKLTAEEVRDMLPELAEFAKQARHRLTPSVAVPEEVADELSKHFDNVFDLDTWLETPNEVFEGKRPLDISHSRLLKTLRGLYD